jgi:hypothetical protein
VTTLLAALVLVTVLACPAHMLWRMRRGQSAGCLPSSEEADSLHARQAQLARQVARARAERG